MNGHKINDCVTILNRILKPDTVLNYDERKELLNFFVEERIKTVIVYEQEVYDKTQKVLSAIKTKKETLVEKQQYEEVARVRDLEKTYERVIKRIEEFKRNNLTASFAFDNDGLSLIIGEGEYNHTIEELKNLGLHLSFFTQTLDRIKLTI